MSQWYEVIKPKGYYEGDDAQYPYELFNYQTGEVSTDNEKFKNYLLNYFNNYDTSSETILDGEQKYKISKANWVIQPTNDFPPVYEKKFEYSIDDLNSCRAALQQAIKYAREKSYALPKKNNIKIVEFYSYDGTEYISLGTNNDYAEYSNSYELGLGEYGKSTEYSNLYQQATKLTYKKNGLSETDFLKLINQVRQNLKLPIPMTYPGTDNTEISFLYEKDGSYWKRIEE